MKKLLWLDLETTGLVAKDDAVLEIAARVTDDKLNVIDTFQAVVYQPDSELAKMNDYVTQMHSKSGLTREVQYAKFGLSKVQADFVAFLTKHFNDCKGKVIICGNTIGFDRGFLQVHMPEGFSWLHYRSVDVSSFAIVLETVYGYRKKKVNAHRALADIDESIEELKTYLEFMKSQGHPLFKDDPEEGGAGCAKHPGVFCGCGAIA